MQINARRRQWMRMHGKAAPTHHPGRVEWFASLAVGAAVARPPVRSQQWETPAPVRSAGPRGDVELWSGCQLLAVRRKATPVSAHLVNYTLRWLMAAGIVGSVTTFGFAQGEDAGRTEYVANCGSCHGTVGAGRVLISITRPVIRLRHRASTGPLCYPHRHAADIGEPTYDAPLRGVLCTSALANPYD
jgi:hypothetical protein